MRTGVVKVSRKRPFPKNNVKRRRPISKYKTILKRRTMIEKLNVSKVDIWQKCVGKKILIGLTEDKPVFRIEGMVQNVFSK